MVFYVKQGWVLGTNKWPTGFASWGVASGALERHLVPGWGALHGGLVAGAGRRSGSTTTFRALSLQRPQDP